MDGLNSVRDVGLVISEEGLAPEEIFEGWKPALSWYCRRLFFWSRPESEEDLICFMAYRKVPEVWGIYIPHVDGKYSNVYDRVLDFLMDDDLKYEEKNTDPGSLHVMISDLIHFSIDVIENESVVANKMVLWSQIRKSA